MPLVGKVQSGPKAAWSLCSQLKYTLGNIPPDVRGNFDGKSTCLYRDVKIYEKWYFPYYVHYPSLNLHKMDIFYALEICYRVGLLNCGAFRIRFDALINSMFSVNWNKLKLELWKMSDMFESCSRGPVSSSLPLFFLWGNLKEGSRSANEQWSSNVSGIGGKYYAPAAARYIFLTGLLTTNLTHVK